MGSIDLNGYSVIVNSISLYNATLTNNGSVPATLTIVGGGAFRPGSVFVNAVICDGTSQLSLVIDCAGYGVCFQNTVSSYTGTTNIEAGHLDITSGSTLGNSAIVDAALLNFINNPGTFTNPISGSGTIDNQGSGAVTLTALEAFFGSLVGDINQ